MTFSFKGRQLLKANGVDVLKDYEMKNVKKLQRESAGKNTEITNHPLKMLEKKYQEALNTHDGEPNTVKGMLSEKAVPYWIL